MTTSDRTVTFFLFDSTTAALWAEDVAVARELPVEVVPTPDGAKAKCNLAIRSLVAHADALKAALDEEGVPFHLHDEGR